jgi:septal ring factor EnvC (AmiA/AmiB activator)
MQDDAKSEAKKLRKQIAVDQELHSSISKNNEEFKAQLAQVQGQLAAKEAMIAELNEQVMHSGVKLPGCMY